jgi:nucleoporin GLE1
MGRVAQEKEVFHSTPQHSKCHDNMERQSSHEGELPPLLSRSHISTSVYDHDVRFDNRNSEDVHKDALAAAQAEHERVREAAMRAFQLNELRESQLRLQQHARQEEERIRIERERALEVIRIRELEIKARQIPKPPPRVPSPPPVESAARVPSPKHLAPPNNKTPPVVQKSTPAQVQKPLSVAQQPTQLPANPFSNPRSPLQIAPTSLDPAPSTEKPLLPVQQQQQKTVQPSQPVTLPSKNGPASHVLPDVDRYTAIHKSLKDLRKHITDAGKENPPFKKKTGEMRRAIRQSVGQLIGEKGANKVPVSNDL